MTQHFLNNQQPSESRRLLDGIKLLYSRASCFERERAASRRLPPDFGVSDE